LPELYPLALRLASDAELMRDDETASAIIRLFAERRDGRAAEHLGSLYEQGRTVKEDPGVAKRWYLAAWEMGNPSALVRLGDLLMSGRLDGEQSRETALECYLAAEEAGNVEGAIRLGDAALDGVGREASVSDALSHYRRAEGKSAYADGKISEILAALDESYRRAVSLQTAGEHARAAALLRDLVKAGHAEAANRLAYLAQNGLGVPLDRRRAASLYAISAERKSKLGVYNLGVCYAEGIGVAFSYRTATRLLEAAQALGVPSAEAVLMRLRDRKRRRELRKLYSLACLLYRRGDFVASSRLLRATAEAGDAASMHRLACHLRRGDGVCINLDEAKLLESRAIEAGYRDCRRCEIGYLRIRREHELAGKLKP
jgi:TPR repeat protein